MAEGPSAKRPPHCRLALLLTVGVSFVLVPLRRSVLRAAPALAAAALIQAGLPARPAMAGPHGLNRLRENEAALPDFTFTDAGGKVAMLFSAGDGVDYEAFGAGTRLISLVSAGE